MKGTGAWAGAPGIAGIGLYRPAGEHTDAYVAARSGIPADVIREKFGFYTKAKAGPGEHVSVMAVAAARAALADAGIEAAELDLIIYAGSEYKDYFVWSAATRIQHELGATRAAAFEVMALCAAGVAGLKVAHDMMRSDPALRTVLVVAASRESDLVDYSRESTRFMLNFGDGAAAAVLRRGAPHRLLGAKLLSDGSFACDVYVPAGGSVLPGGGAAERLLDVPDIAGLRQRLNPVSLGNFVHVIEEALAASGRSVADLRFLSGVHMKRSAHDALLQALGLRPEQAWYAEDWGHVEAADQLIGLWEARRRGLLQPGDTVALAAAGTGYTWGAIIIEW